MNSVQNPAYLVGLEARFAAAARHSRMVRILRVAVPQLRIQAVIDNKHEACLLSAMRKPNIDRVCRLE